MASESRIGVGAASRVAVAGAGSIGCYVGGCLALAGRNVALLLRPALGDAIAAHGLRITDLAGNDRLVAPARLALSSAPDAALAPADVILVTVKSGATAEMADVIARHARPQAVVVSLQNGVGNMDVLRARLGATHRLVAGMVPFNVVQTHVQGRAPRFHRATSGTIRIAAGEPGLRDLLNATGAPVAEHRDMTGVLWGKLILNLNNALNALSGSPLATQIADRRWRLVLAAQIEEALGVLKAAGIRPTRIEGVAPGMIPAILRLPDFLFRVLARRMLAIDPQARSSMWEDLQRHRPTEIDHFQGAILALAAKTAMSASLTQRIAQLVKQAETEGDGSPGLQPDQITA
ncbi:MAG: 2-dehydropantoate 2-reductase [Hyphomicrobiaceae bacterium]|nr:MAG: 2-dehydropantoate 2-reductase [Hyphomicrobiaceae bacterium]